MAEGARLESVFTGNRNVGSNPTPSARPTFADLRRITLRLASVTNIRQSPAEVSVSCSDAKSRNSICANGGQRSVFVPFHAVAATTLWDTK